MVVCLSVAVPTLSFGVDRLPRRLGCPPIFVYFVNSHGHTRSHTHTFVHTRTYTRPHTCSQVHTRTRTRPHMNTRSQTHTRIHVSIYTHLSHTTTNTLTHSHGGPRTCTEVKLSGPRVPCLPRVEKVSTYGSCKVSRTSTRSHFQPT